MHFYEAEGPMDLFNSNFVSKQTTILHLICKHNHCHLFDSFITTYKEAIDINL